MKANRADLLPAMIEDAKRQSAEYRAKADVLDALISGWEEELAARPEGSGDVVARRRETKRSRSKHSSESSLVGEKQKNLQAVIEKILGEVKRPLKTAEIAEEMGLRGIDLSQNYVGTLLSRGEQFTLLQGGKWMLVEQPKEDAGNDTATQSKAESETAAPNVSANGNGYFPDDDDMGTPPVVRQQQPVPVVNRAPAHRSQVPSQRPVGVIRRPAQPAYPADDDFDDSDPFADE